MGVLESRVRCGSVCGASPLRRMSGDAGSDCAAARRSRHSWCNWRLRVVSRVRAPRVLASGGGGGGGGGGDGDGEGGGDAVSEDGGVCVAHGPRDCVRASCGRGVNFCAFVKGTGDITTRGRLCLIKHLTCERLRSAHSGYRLRRVGIGGIRAHRVQRPALALAVLPLLLTLARLLLLLGRGLLRGRANQKGWAPSRVVCLHAAQCLP